MENPRLPESFVRHLPECSPGPGHLFGVFAGLPFEARQQPGFRKLFVISSHPERWLYRCGLSSADLPLSVKLECSPRLRRLNVDSPISNFYADTNSRHWVSSNCAGILTRRAVQSRFGTDQKSSSTSPLPALLRRVALIHKEESAFRRDPNELSNSRSVQQRPMGHNHPATISLFRMPRLPRVAYSSNSISPAASQHWL